MTFKAKDAEKAIQMLVHPYPDEYKKKKLDIPNQHTRFTLIYVYMIIYLNIHMYIYIFQSGLRSFVLQLLMMKSRGKDSRIRLSQNFLL